jgi:hypothetical protein
MVLVLALCQIRCGDEVDHLVPNARPHVRITGGIVDSDSAEVHYRVDLRWLGWDEDGMVMGYEWAVDDTTLEDSWHWTEESGGGFKFRATTEPESGDSLFHDWHSFFIRAVDNESARSNMDSRWFNATTIGPQTWILYPLIGHGLIRLTMPSEVVWEGEDLDASTPSKIPEFYEYKLVKVELGDDPLEALRTGENALADTLEMTDSVLWVRVTSDVTSVILTDLTVGGLYVFGLRAIDEAGAIEPVLEAGRNYFVFEVVERACPVVVTISEATLGNHTFPGDVWAVEVPSNTPIRFTWVGDASHCGRRPGKVKYCLGDCGGWTDLSGLPVPLVFPDRDHGKIHNFYLYMRDETHDPRSETFCWVQMKVIALPLDKTVLIVDDATPPRGLAGTDVEHDALRDRVFSCLTEYLEPGEEIGIFDMYGRDEGSKNPRNIPFSLLARYKVVIWNSYFHGRHQSGLARNETERGVLSQYVGGGGRLFLFGPRPVGTLAEAFDYGGDGICPDIPGVEDPAWDEESFIWNFLHIRSCVRGPRDGRTDGWIGSRSAHAMYPDLEIDPEVWDPYRPGNEGEPVGGIKLFEVYDAPRRLPSEDDPGLDTIYVAETFNLYSPRWGKPCALRYESTPRDTALNLDHGRVFLQMFDYLFAREEGAREAACKAVGWLLTGRDE